MASGFTNIDDSYVKAVSTEPLPVGEFRCWYNFIKDNNSSELQNKLTSTEGDVKGVLLNGTFQYPEKQVSIGKKKQHDQPPFLVTRPWCLPAAFNSHECIKILYQHGIDTTCTDVNGKHIAIRFRTMRIIESSL